MLKKHQKASKACFSNKHRVKYVSLLICIQLDIYQWKFYYDFYYKTTGQHINIHIEQIIHNKHLITMVAFWVIVNICNKKTKCIWQWNAAKPVLEQPCLEERAESSHTWQKYEVEAGILALFYWLEYVKKIQKWL